MDFPTADANPIVSIWSGSSAPEVELIVLDNPIGLVGQTDFSFTPSSAFVLSANNTYWIHLRPEIIGQGPNYYWIATAPATIPFGTQASAVGFLFNDSPSGFLNRLEIRGTAVPEPNSFACLSVCLYGLARYILGSKNRAGKLLHRQSP